MFNKNKKSQATQITKGLSYWFLVLSILVLAAGTAWTAYVGQKTIDFSKDQALVQIQKPLFNEYLNELGIQKPESSPASPSAELPKTIPLGNPIAAAKEKKLQEEQQQLNAKKASQVAPQAAPQTDPSVAKSEESAAPTLQKIFSELRVFENKRTEIVFKKIEPVIGKVQKGSLADDWGFKKGDEIKMVASVPVQSLWDFYQLVEETPTTQLGFLVGRGKKQLKISVTEHGEKVLANQVGLLFVIPKGLSYMSKSEASDLANQFDERFVKVIGGDFKKDYVASLAGFSAGLIALPIAQEADLVKYEKLNASAMLAWHHEKFLAAIEKFHTEMRANVAEQTVVMAAFQQALIGFAAAFLLCVIAFVIRSRVVSKQALES